MKKIKKVIVFVVFSGIIVVINFISGSNNSSKEISSGTDGGVGNVFADIPPPPGCDFDDGDGEL